MWIDQIEWTYTNQWPTVPQLSGPTSGESGTEYTFSATSTDPDGDTIRYIFDWGDGQQTATGYVASGQEVSALHTWSSNQTYTVKVRAEDNANPSALSNWQSQSMTITTSIQIDVPIATSYDDAEETVSSGSVSLSSSDLELGVESSSQVVGLRFTNMSMPPGAEITLAYVEFTVDETRSGACSLTIEGEDVDNSAQFVSTNYNISSRTRTSASVNWSPPDWTSIGSIQQTSEIKTIIQEIVDRAGWQSGYALTLIITGTGTRTAEAYSGGEAVLHVEYNVP